MKCLVYEPSIKAIYTFRICFTVIEFIIFFFFLFICCTVYAPYVQQVLSIFIYKWAKLDQMDQSSWTLSKMYKGP